eukprot:jgi/Tetstr1/439293/TSEL_027734.t1
MPAPVPVRPRVSAAHRCSGVAAGVALRAGPPPAGWRQRRGDAGIARGLPSFPTKGPLGGAIMGGTFLGPIGAVLGYMGMLGMEKAGGKGAAEAEPEAPPDTGLTPELVARAKAAQEELLAAETALLAAVRDAEAAGEAAAAAEAGLAAAAAELRDAKRRRGGEGAEVGAYRLRLVREERAEALRTAQLALLRAGERVETRRGRLEALRDAALDLEARIQRNMAITRKRLEENPPPPAKPDDKAAKGGKRA